MDVRASWSRSVPKWARSGLTAGLLAVASTAQSQVPLGPVMTAGAVAPLLIPSVLLIGLALAYSPAVEDAVQHKNWPAVERIASKELDRLAKQRDQQPAQERGTGPPEESGQRLLLARAYARQRMGRYAEALADYRTATDTVESPDSRVLLNRGICEMVLGRWGEAEHVMMRLAEREPQRWEPQYNLGVIRSITGDRVGAQLALERLRPLNTTMADALDAQYVRRLSTPGDTTPPRTEPQLTELATREVARALAELPILSSEDVGSASVPGRLPQARLAIDGQAISLPPGEWVLATRREFRISGSFAGSLHQSEELTFPALAGSAFMIEDDALRAIVTFASNRTIREYQTVLFEPEPCDSRGAFVTGRIDYENRDAPGTCAYARRLNAPGESDDEDVRNAHALALRLGARIPDGWYEFLYTGYRKPDSLDYQMLWSVRVLWPATALAGDLVAIDWLAGFPYAAFPSRQSPGSWSTILGQRRYEGGSIGHVGR